MIDVQEFKRRCAEQTADEIVEGVILTGDALHVSRANEEFLRESLAKVFDLTQADIDLRIVGSAKLGFSIIEKTKHEVHYPRYRAFSGISDIDTAVVSPKLFRLIWDALSVYAHGHPWIPWNSQRLGDYMVYGWLRPDCFPRGHRIRMCDNWSDLFRHLSKDARFGRRSVRGGLFYSTDDLKRYHRRSVIECVNIEQGKL